MDCPEHGVKTVTLPWALPHRRFTILFERFAIEVLLMTQTVEATMNQLLLAITLSLVPTLTLHAQLLGPPTNVKELWEDFDPRREPLDPQIVRQWEKDGVVFRYVTFHVGSFKNSSARLAGFYAFPKSAEKRPALLHIHGGGQRAFLHEVEFYAKHGYACLSINWGAREMEDATSSDPNTDWGAVDPTQNNVAGYSNLKPGNLYLDPFDSPRNNNWYLLTLGARRGLSFLEQQPEVDPERLGVYGHSMGGSLAVYVAGCDERIKAAAPSVGGSGFRTQPNPLSGQQAIEKPNGDIRLFDATLGFESYAPRISAPLLWLGATNDFHGIMDDTYRTGKLIPHSEVRYAFCAHMNHRFMPEFAVTRRLWFDHILKDSCTFPNTPQTKLDLSSDDHIPVFHVTPDSSHEIAQVDIYYSTDPDPRPRFWRSVDAIPQGETWSSKLPILSTDKPLLVFANVSYRMEHAKSEPFGRPTERFAISSLLHTRTPKELKDAHVQATDKSESLVDDFQHAWRDWYRLEAGNPHHWEFSTRKINDPKWQGLPDQKLGLNLQIDRPNVLVILLTENFFRPDRGKSMEYAAVVKLDGGPQSQRLLLEPKDFFTPDGNVLQDWSQIDLLSLRAYHQSGDKLLGSQAWSGPLPVFEKLYWR